MANTVEPLVLAATTTGARSARPAGGTKSFQASGTTSAGAGAATIVIQGSNDQTNWVTLGTITLVLGTASTTDGFTSNDRFGYVRGNVTAISGTDATVSAYVSY